MNDLQDGHLIVLVPVAIILVLLSMFFSAAESAFLAVNKLRVRLLKNQKNKQANRVWKLLNNKERLINTLLICNNIVNIILSSIITYIAVSIFGSAGVGIATFVATMLLLIFGEISPKTIATHHPEPIAFFSSGIISILETILYPLVSLFTYISSFILSLRGIDTKKKKVSFTEEEIKTFIDVGNEQGVIKSNEKNMMHRVFSFSDLEAKDIMVPRKNIIALPVNVRYQTIIEYSERYKLSRFPVYKNDIDDIVGILYVKDLLFYKNNTSSFDVKKVMRSPLFILATKKMSSIQQMLRENRQGMAVVIDEYSGTDGVLTTEDITREIFGSITDEYRPVSHREDVQIENKDFAEIDGLSRLSEINEQLNIHLHSDHCETIGGFISETLGRIPLEKDFVEAESYRFTVTKMDDKRVSRVEIKKSSV